MKNTIRITALYLGALIANHAYAETKQSLDIERLALEPDGIEEGGVVEFNRTYVPHIVVAPRIEHGVQARFDVTIGNWPLRSVLLLTVESVGEDARFERWRCIAIASIEECLSDKQLFRFLPTDERIVLTAIALPTDDREAIAFLRP
ncbi:MAG: hypothetical protein AAGD10_11605 [Myxococcota bacterium]